MATSGKLNEKSDAPAETLAIPPEFDRMASAIVDRAIRALFYRHPDLKRQKNKAPRTTRTVTRVERIVPGEEFGRTLARLCEENVRAERLLAELRQARAELLNATGASR